MPTPPPCPLPFHILRPAGLLLPLFLPQDTVNALSDLLGFFHFFFQRKIPLIERFPLGGQLGILRFPYLHRQGGLAVHHAFDDGWYKEHSGQILLIRLGVTAGIIVAVAVLWAFGDSLLKRRFDADGGE